MAELACLKRRHNSHRRRGQVSAPFCSREPSHGCWKRLRLQGTATTHRSPSVRASRFRASTSETTAQLEAIPSTSEQHDWYPSFATRCGRPPANEACPLSAIFPWTSQRAAGPLLAGEADPIGSGGGRRPSHRDDRVVGLRAICAGEGRDVLSGVPPLAHSCAQQLAETSKRVRLGRRWDVRKDSIICVLSTLSLS